MTDRIPDSFLVDDGSHSEPDVLGSLIIVIRTRHQQPIGGQHACTIAHLSSPVDMIRNGTLWHAKTGGTVSSRVSEDCERERARKAL